MNYCDEHEWRDAARSCPECVKRNAVYDAAMARHEAKVRYDATNTASPEHGQAWADFWNAEEDLEAACRRAKEGR